MAQDDDDRALRIVLVDSRPDRRRLLRQILLSTGLALGPVDEADDKAMALALVDPGDEGLVVLEILPVDEGLLAITELRRRAPRWRIVACSFQLDPTTRQRALDAGADACLDKPLRTADLRKLVADLYPDGLPWAGRDGVDGLHGAHGSTLVTSGAPSAPEELPSPAGISGGGPIGPPGP
jgi:CheY-like chemotaxis protein